MNDQNKQLTPLKAIRHHCIECAGGNQKAPLDCDNRDCVFYLYRLGHNPARKRIGQSANLGHFRGLSARNLAKTAIIDGNTDRICVGGKWYKAEGSKS